MYRQSKVTQGTKGLSPIAFIFHIKANEKELKSFNNYVLLCLIISILLFYLSRYIIVATQSTYATRERCKRGSIGPRSA